MAAVEKLIEKAALANAYSHDGKAQAGAVLGHVLAHDSKFKSKIPELRPQIDKIVADVNKLKPAEQEKQLRKLWPEYFAPKEKPKPKGLPPLRNAVRGKVVMRFAPSPSGPLHIGHAHVLGLNSEYCRLYKGKLLVRIDDTNAMNIFEPAYKMIPEDADWVTKNNVSKVITESSMMKNYYAVAEELLKKGFAYVCSCNNENWKQLMIKSLPCACRHLQPAQQMERWRAMLKGDIEEGKVVVRIKTDLAHKNPAIRDWPALRIQEAKHPKTGKKYRVWPLMNFAVAVDDHFTGITHAIRAKEHRDNEARQNYIYNYLGWKMPVHIYVGRHNFKDLKISKTKVRKAIDEKKYSGWDDVRLPFLRALKRRGYLPDTFIKYAVEVGPSENDKTVTQDEFFELFNAINREILDPLADRYFFVPNPKQLNISNAPVVKTVTAPVHPEKKARRKIKVSKNIWIAMDDFKQFSNKEVRLLDLYNIKLDKKAEFTSKENKEIPRIQWVSDDHVNVEMLMPDGKIIRGLAEGNVSKLKAGEIIQFMRFGFCRLDKKEKNKLIFAFAHR